jgi:hypothetical protein
MRNLVSQVPPVLQRPCAVLQPLVPQPLGTLIKEIAAPIVTMILTRWPDLLQEGVADSELVHDLRVLVVEERLLGLGELPSGVLSGDLLFLPFFLPLTGFFGVRLRFGASAQSSCHLNSSLQFQH